MAWLAFAAVLVDRKRFTRRGLADRRSAAVASHNLKTTLGAFGPVSADRIGGKT